MKLSNDWVDYEILDMADGKKLERWGKFILDRPDPQIVWKEKTNKELWNKANAIYHRSKKGGGHWENKTSVPSNWQIKYKDLTFNIKQMGFKHTGLFPEQAGRRSVWRRGLYHAEGGRQRHCVCGVRRPCGGV